MSEWIKCSDRLPEERQPVLTIVASKTIPNPVVEAFIVDGKWCVIETWPDKRPMFPPTHWMPLPEPPEEESSK